MRTTRDRLAIYFNHFGHWKEPGMTTDQSLAATAVAAWKINIDRSKALFSKQNADELQREIAPGRNRLSYLLGHLAAVHDGMLPLLGIGARLHPELDAPFLKAADRAVADADLPSVEELKRAWDTVNARLLDAFETFSADDWASRHTAVSEPDFATNPLRNRLAVLLSRTGHVSYHLGQLRLAAD
jgi:hypothetical protein